MRFASTWKPPGAEGPATRGRRARTSKEADKIKNNLAAQGPGGPTCCLPGESKTPRAWVWQDCYGPDLSQPETPASWGVTGGVGLPSPECSAGLALETHPPTHPQSPCLLGPPHGTTSLGCKCFYVLFLFLFFFFLWDMGATEIFIKHSFFLWGGWPQFFFIYFIYINIYI